MNRNFPRLFNAAILVVLCIAMTTSCGSSKSKKEEIPQLKVLELKGVKVPIFLEMVGQAEAIPTVAITARAQGFLEKIAFTEGTIVKKGQLLFTIEPDQYNNNLDLQKAMLDNAEASWEKAKLDVERLKPLLPTQAISQNDYDKAVTNEKECRANVASNKAQLETAKLNLSYTKIYTPITGYIGKASYQPGNLVGQTGGNNVLATVSALDPIYFNFQMHENDYLWITKYLVKHKEDMKAELKEALNVFLFLSDKQQYENSGKLDFIDRDISTQTGTIAMRASFPNSEGVVKPGSFGTVRMILSEKEDAILIPQSALSQIQDKFFVFKLGAENKVNRIAVTIGRRIDNRVVIYSGLKVGDKILTEGFQMFEEGMQINPIVVKDTIKDISIDM
jgi:membrane fusion protein (multidrug efflux system)